MADEPQPEVGSFNFSEASIETGNLYIAAEPVRMTSWSFGGMATVDVEGTVTIDWPKVEDAAVSERTSGPWFDQGITRAIARLLLEARDQGRQERAVGFE